MGERVIPTFELTRNYERIRQEIHEGIERVLESQHFILGKEVQDFENEVASYLEVPFAIGCASGSDALLLALMGLGIREGDEVITTPFTFFASASCIVRSGARPVFVDIDPRTYNMDPRQVIEALTPKTKAVIAVHLFGQMCELEEIAPQLKERNIALVEDCAQSFGAWRTLDGAPRRGGSIGDVGCFSFFPTKNLGCYGDG
ncbi:MAG TPA: aminotransferase class V-fold PLP-dependent enzyme, partial [Synergistaceae bacterium]|nr:aminotransferase class V-fold PLP-dependent enzyme [Synergistaceae bacterium]